MNAPAEAFRCQALAKEIAAELRAKYDLKAASRLARRSLALRPATLALSPMRDTLIEGFSHFVSSMTAPIASGWSGCRVGLAPTGKRRLVTAHTQAGLS
jgi:hypothetical protein